MAGAELTPAVTSTERTTTISLPTGGTAGPVELSYVVRGASIATADGGSSVIWALLQGLNLPVGEFDATVMTPGPFTSLDCAAGDPAAPGACTFYGGGTHDNPLPVFHHEGLSAGGFVEATGLPLTDRHLPAGGSLGFVQHADFANFFEQSQRFFQIRLDRRVQRGRFDGVEH